MLRGVESGFVATPHPLKHAVTYIILLLNDALPDYRLCLLQLLFVVLEDALHVVFGLRFKPFQLLVEGNTLLL